jgi:hypothetical protein
MGDAGDQGRAAMLSNMMVRRVGLVHTQCYARAFAN